MLLNSINFLLFFTVFFIIYWALPKKKDQKINWQNHFLLIGNIVFYFFFSWKLLLFLLFSGTSVYYIGKQIYKNEENDKKRAIWFWIGLIFTLGQLVYFKYTNFFIESFVDFSNLIGLSFSYHTLKIIAPLGISYYTFKQLSYLIDINQESYEPTKDSVYAYVTYVSFFPTLLCGPIDRPTDFLPQLQRPRQFDYDTTVLGFQQILWGLFKKMVIADNCGMYVDKIWANFQDFSASSLVLAAFLYSIQLYADFSGYSDIAIGIGKMMGFKVAQNFNYPYFALNIADFWRRWHISLTLWVTDYIFTPLSFVWRSKGKLGLIYAIILDFLIIGFWHGADWQYLAYGLFHGLLFIPLILSKKGMKTRDIRKNKIGLPVFRDFVNIIGTFTLVTFSFIIFRAPSLSKAYSFIHQIVNKDFFSVPFLINRDFYLYLFVFILLFFLIETRWFYLKIDNTLQKSIVTRYLIYFILLFCIFSFSGEIEHPIYALF